MYLVQLKIPLKKIQKAKLRLFPKPSQLQHSHTIKTSLDNETRTKLGVTLH